MAFYTTISFFTHDLTNQLYLQIAVKTSVEKYPKAKGGLELMARKASQSKKQLQKMLNQPQDTEFGDEHTPDFILPCPKCDKRAIDVLGRPERTIRVRHKCPHCGNLVVTAILATKSSKV